MKNKNKKAMTTEFVSYRNKRIVLVLVLFLSLFSFSWADENGVNIFKDRDQDGLSDQEEIAIGTDPDKADTDGDGYSDKVELESGFDPLVPAPNDRMVKKTEQTNLQKESVLGEITASSENNGSINSISSQDNQKETEEKENLTEEFLNKFSAQNEKSEEGEDGIEISSLTENQIQNLVEETLVDFNLEKEIELIPEEELKFLPKPKGSEEEVKKKTKKQIEEYLAAVSYIAVVNSPILIQSESELRSKLMSFSNQMALSIQAGDKEKIKELKATGQKVFEEIKKIEAPLVLKDHHQLGLSIFKYFLEQDEETILNQDDPLAIGLFLGKVQGAINELDNLENSLRLVLEEYEVESFFIPAGGNN